MFLNVADFYPFALKVGILPFCNYYIIFVHVINSDEFINLIMMYKHDANKNLTKGVVKLFSTQVTGKLFEARLKTRFKGKGV